MRNCALLIVLALGSSLIPATAQVSNVDAPSSNKNLADRIQKGDSVAILEAGKTGDSSFIPQLLAYRRKSGKRKDFQVIAVQLALAKLGQQPELQQIRCELLFGSPSVRYDAVGKLVYVGGWFSLEAVTRVLANPEYRFGGDGRGAFAPPGDETFDDCSQPSTNRIRSVSAHLGTRYGEAAPMERVDRIASRCAW